MFEKIKENEYVQKILELWNIPRYRSLIILFIYFIFFAFVIASINTNSSLNTNSNNIKVNVMEKYIQMDNYQYNATIKNETEINLIGKVNKDKQIIMFNNDTYYYNNINLYKNKANLYIKTDDNLLDFEVWRFSPLFINNLIKKGKLESKTEYTDGTNSKTYLVQIKDFLKAYNNVVTDDTRTFEIIIYQNEKQITKVELELTDIYNMGEYSNSYDYEVILEYSLVDEIGPIIVNVESSD